MQTAKEAILYKLDHYQIEISPLGQKRLAISIIDPILRAQFAQKDLFLDIFGVTTLKKALERKNKQIKASIDYKKIGQNQILSIKITVQSAFLKQIEETVYLKKIRDVSQSETMTKEFNILNKKLQDIKAQEGQAGFNCYVGTRLQQKKYLCSEEDKFYSLCQAKLKKGKYLLTFSFLLKAENYWMYLYFGERGSAMTNSGFYVANATNYSSHLVRKVYQVTNQQQTISFSTYCGDSYAVEIKNAIITAKRLNAK